MEQFKSNISIWDKIYERGHGMLRYPDSALVTLTSRKLNTKNHPKILDYGFGSGANMRMLLRRGHQIHGIEIADNIIDLNQQLLSEEGLYAQLHKVTESVLPFEAQSFDAIIAWHVLGYNSLQSLQSRINEFHRILRPKGILIGTLPAYGDISHEHSHSINGMEFLSKIPTQQGAEILCFEDEQAVRDTLCLDAEVSLMQIPLLDGTLSRHWVFSHEK